MQHTPECNTHNDNNNNNNIGATPACNTHNNDLVQLTLGMAIRDGRNASEMVHSAATNSSSSKGWYTCSTRERHITQGRQLHTNAQHCT
eukprot:1159915-Pelagomonas_calceolata.AAC.7